MTIAEGIAVFESIYEKLDSSENRTQTEKIELDLKKEIKKLQRYRDNIKTWAASNEIKDKKPLMDHRRAIEVQMERFKAVEREVKTKQFSKEGLNNAAKTDPKEREKHEMSRWLSEMVDELERQIEQAETEAESTSLQAKKGKANTAKAERLAELEARMDRHRWHTRKLEQALRALENGDIDTERIGAIKEDVQYYVESNQDPDFAEDEAIYDDLNLGEDAASDDDNDDGADAPAPAPVPATVKSPEISKSKPVLGKTKPEGNKAITVGNVKAPPTTTKTINKVSSAAPASVEAVAEKDADESSKKGPATVSAPVSMLKYASAAATAANAKSKIDTRTGGPGSVTQQATSLPQQQLQQQQQQPPQPPQPQQQPPQQHQPQPPPQQSQSAQSPARQVQPQAIADTASHAQPPQAVAQSQIQQPSPPLTPGSIAEAWQRHAVSSTGNEVKASPVSTHPLPVAAVSAASVSMADSTGQQTSQPNYHIPACLIDLIPEEHALTEEERDALLDSSMKYCPRDVENDPPNHYVPKEPFPTPPYYPTTPLDLFNHPNSMEKVEIDTLFYIFYYQRGTYQQYLASRELKKQAWRFHKRYLTWFQRHEEPKIITDEFESGTYRYFDFEASWVQRKKNDFKFQYAYLEDDAM